MQQLSSNLRNKDDSYPLMILRMQVFAVLSIAAMQMTLFLGLLDRSQKQKQSRQRLAIFCKLNSIWR